MGLLSLTPAAGCFFALALLFGHSPAGLTTQDDSTAETELTGHAAMLKLLAEIRQRNLTSDPFLGNGEAAKLQRKLDALPPRALRKRWRVLRELGFDALRLGQTEEAIRRYEEAADIATGLGPKLPPAMQVTGIYELAIAYLRFAENENCVARHNTDSCLMPIEGGGVHVDERGSRKAIELLAEVLKRKPNDPASMWLLNIAYMTLGEYPADVPEKWLIAPQTFASDAEFPRFVNVAQEKGLDTFNLSGGSIVDDFNGDGHLDIITCTWDSADSMWFFAGNGKGEFEDRSSEAGIGNIPGGLNIMQADYDNDGDLDILVLRGAWLRARGTLPNSLLQNDGAGHFKDVTFDAGLGLSHFPTQTAAWADYDLDGDLDLYVGNESDRSLRAPSQLFQNQGDGRFVDVAGAAGVQNLRYAKGVTWGDYNDDRYPDLYVSNSDKPNRLYHNNGDGTFTDKAEELGLLAPRASFATWFWDYDNDGALDLFCASYLPRLGPAVESMLGYSTGTELHALYRGDGTGGFENVTKAVGLTRSTIVMGSNFGDLDSDGYLDFYLGTGYPGYEGIMPNKMYWNRGGTSFADVTTAGGFGHLQKGHAIAFADLDGDGDQDVFAEMGGAFPGDAFGNALFENPGFGNHWIDVRLIGVKSNRFGVGARIRCTLREGETTRDVYRWVNSGGSFGANPLTQSIGLGKAEAVERLEVYWPASDFTQVLKNLPVDQRIEITESPK